MIHRKWSLLTGPMVILGGIVGAVVVADVLFIENHPYFKREERKPDAASLDK